MNNQTIDNLIPSCFRCERVEQAKCIDVTAEAVNKITLALPVFLVGSLILQLVKVFKFKKR